MGEKVAALKRFQRDSEVKGRRSAGPRLVAVLIPALQRNDRALRAKVNVGDPPRYRTSLMVSLVG